MDKLPIIKVFNIYKLLLLKNGLVKKNLNALDLNRINSCIGDRTNDNDFQMEYFRNERKFVKNWLGFVNSNKSYYNWTFD